MKTKWIRAAAFCVCAFLVTFSGVSRAEETALHEDQWTFRMGPYFWFLSIDGESTMNGRTGDVDLSFSDIFDMFNYGGAFRLDASHSKWGVKLDSVMVDMGEDFTGPLGNKAEIDLRQVAVDFAVSYNVLTQPMGQTGEMTLAPYAGFRYNYLKQKVSLPAPIGTIGGSEDWVDLIVGASVKMEFSEKFSANLEGDAGGFGIGSGSDLTWQVIASFNYRLSEKVGFRFGYRYIDIDYSRGSGSDTFGLDAAYDGPFVGLTLNW